MIRRRNRQKQTVSLQERLLSAAKDACDAAAKLPPGPERDALIKKAREIEIATRLNGWITSPGLQSPN